MCITANIRASGGNDTGSMHSKLSCWEIIVITVNQRERQELMWACLKKKKKEKVVTQKNMSG